MKFCQYTHPHWGTVFDRITEATAKYAPRWVKWVDEPDDADVYIVHVVGEGEVPELERPHKRRVIIQQCYFTAQIERVDYVPYWKEAVLTISFHDLTQYTDEEFNFKRMPWGADRSIFKLKETQLSRIVDILATGYVAKDECIDKVFEAARRTGKMLYHTGRDFGWDTAHYRYLDFLPNSQFVDLLNRTKYVSCLRLVEGFELLGIEGLFCGARPLVFNLPTYDLYRKHAYTINIDDDITRQVAEILDSPPRPFSDEERQEILDTYSWDVLIPDMFSSIRRSL